MPSSVAPGKTFHEGRGDTSHSDVQRCHCSAYINFIWEFHDSIRSARSTASTPHVDGLDDVSLKS